MQPSCGVWAVLLGLGALSACGGIAVVDGEPEDDDTPTTTTTTATGRAEVRLASAVASANCQPAVPADPLNLVAMLDVTNPSADFASIEVGEAVLDSILGSVSFPMTPSVFDVAPNTSTTVELTKVPQSGVGINACELCAANTTMLELELRVTLTNAGETLTATGDVASLGCVF